jgi:hypothetical protein
MSVADIPFPCAEAEIAPMQQSQSVTATTYRIAPDLRRCCWYVIAAAILMIPLALWVVSVAEYAPPKRRPEPLPIAIMFLCLALAATIPLRFRLRVDQSGITRRRVFWGPAWHWSDFASGRILKKGFRIVDPSRPWGDRKLTLDYLSDSDRRDVFNSVNRFYRLPPAAKLPEKLELRCGLRVRVTFEPTRIAIVRGKQTREFSWGEVHHVLITRSEPLRREFLNLVVALPDDEIELRRHNGHPTWRGATDEQINEFIAAHAISADVRSFISGEDCDDPDYLRYLIRTERQRLRGMVGCLSIWGPLLIGCLIWMAIKDGEPFRALMMTVVSLIPLSPLGLIVIQHGDRVRGLEDRLAAATSKQDCVDQR